MKKALIALLLAFTVVLFLFGCGNDETPTPTPTPSQSAASSSGASNNDDVNNDTVSSSTTVSKGDDVNSNTANSRYDDVNNDTTVSSSGNTNNDTVSSNTTVSSNIGNTDPEPEPEPEPEPPESVPIDIAKDGYSDYLVVYDDSDISVTNFALKLLDYLKNTHGIFIKSTPYSSFESGGKCIYIGDFRETKFVKARLNEANDFGACISGSDYVLYATNSRLYDYLYDILTTEILVTIRNGNWSTEPRKDFMYHKSAYKDVSYVDYVLSKKQSGLTQDILLSFFDKCIFEARDGTVIPYRIYIPYDYDASKEYPVLTIFHGAGERGTDNVSQMKHMLLNMFSNDDSPLWDSIVVCPQCPGNDQWVDTPWENGNYSVESVEESNELKAVLEIMDWLERNYSTDVDRYYLAGLSMGGFAVWDLLMRHPEKFAGAVPLCGGADYTQAEKLVNMPIYTIHGTNDGDVPISGTQQIVDALKALGSKIEYEELAGYGHNVWDYASKKAEIWTWLFEQTRP